MRLIGGNNVEVQSATRVKLSRGSASGALPAQWCPAAHRARQHAVISIHGAMKGFSNNVLVQPATSPDMNMEDVAFSWSLLSDVSLLSTGNRLDLLAFLVLCWKVYPASKIKACLCLYMSDSTSWGVLMEMTTFGTVECDT